MTPRNPQPAASRLSATLVGLALAAAIAGCAARIDPHLAAMIETAPALGAVPASVEAPPVEVAGRIRMHDLDLGIAAGWRAGAVSVFGPGSPDLGYGETLRADLTARHESGEQPAVVFYRQEEGIRRRPPPGLIQEMAHAVRDPTKFLARYGSDLALFEAAQCARPDVLDRLHGDEKRAVLALLCVKRHLHRPTTRVAMPAGTAYRWRCETEPLLMAALFDRQGRRRGAISLLFPDPLPASVADRLLGQLLAGVRFAEAE